MKKYCLLIVLLLTAWYAGAQTAAKTEEKDTLQVRIGNTITKLDGITGWIIDHRGKWVSSPGRIPFEDPDMNNEYYEKYPIGTDNCKQIQVINMSILGKRYVAVLFLYTKGYDKPIKGSKTNETEWVNYSAGDYYVMEPGELKNLRLDSLGKKKFHPANLKFIYFGTIGYAYPAQIPGEMKKHIEYNITDDHQKETEAQSFLQFSLHPVMVGGGSFMRYTFGLIYAEKDLKPDLPDYNILNQQFWQVPFANWKSFVSLAK